jgi:hypothetical protein
MRHGALPTVRGDLRYYRHAPPGACIPFGRTGVRSAAEVVTPFPRGVAVSAPCGSTLPHHTQALRAGSLPRLCGLGARPRLYSVVGIIPAITPAARNTSQSSPAFSPWHRVTFGGGTPCAGWPPGTRLEHPRTLVGEQVAAQTNAAIAVAGGTRRAFAAAAAAPGETRLARREGPTGRPPVLAAAALVGLVAPLLAVAAGGHHDVWDPECAGQRGEGAANPAGEYPAPRRGRGPRPGQTVKALSIHGGLPGITSPVADRGAAARSLAPGVHTSSVVRGA